MIGQSFRYGLSGVAAALCTIAAPASADETMARAQRFNAGAQRSAVRNGMIIPRWIAGEDRFWYIADQADGARRFVTVDAATGKASDAFDQTIVAAGLAAALGQPVDPRQLPFSSFRFSADHRSIDLALDATGKQWRCQLAKPGCSAIEVNRDEIVSPDGQWAAFVQDHNLWVRSIATGARKPLTTDGVEHYAYGGITDDTTHTITTARFGLPNPAQIVWSPDSRHLLAQRIDERAVREMQLLEHVPLDGSLRPKLHDYRYPLPGDTAIAMARLVSFDVATGKRVDIDGPALVAAYLSPIALSQAWWSSDARKIYYLERDRFYRTYTLHVADAATGASRPILSESGKTNVTINWPLEKPLVRTLKNGDFIWFSERSGWGQLYYYTAEGRLRNAITTGDWVVRAILSIDEDKGRLFFTGLGRDAARQPYDQYIYSVRFDGRDLRLLTPEDADHNQNDPEIKARIGGGIALASFDRAEERAAISPSGRYLVDSYSRPDLAPHLVLRSSDGRLIKQLETADYSRLTQSGFVLPEPFSVLAADGKTRIYGTLFKPSNFDPTKRYAVIEAIYPGPWTNINARAFMAMFSDQNRAYDRQALAELGFIVVTLDGRGNLFRSKSFWDQSYGRMGTAGMLDDHIAALRQLAARRHYIDLDRVGIYGLSGGGFASSNAILRYPDFYKVAVSTAGDHDQRLYQAWWGDLYNGPDYAGYSDTINARFAGGLRGKLMLVHGDMDDNVHPANTLRLVDALIKADKDFDLIVVPGANHMMNVPGDQGKTTAYLQRRRWQYFIDNLKGPEPGTPDTKP